MDPSPENSLKYLLIDVWKRRCSLKILTLPDKVANVAHLIVLCEILYIVAP